LDVPSFIRSLVAFFLLLAATARGQEFEPAGAILARHCVSCHHAADPAGGLDLTSSAAARKDGESGQPVLSSGQPGTSYLLERVSAGEMPPEGKGRALTAAERKTLENWIAAGAPWPENRVLSAFDFTTDTRAGRDWWSLAAPRELALPRLQDASWLRNPIDAFVLAKLEAAGLRPSPETGRATLIRRVYFDLVGLPPSPQAIQAFVADAAPDAYERVVDGLLASSQYGERWARHWLDVVRFGESNGYETNTARTNAWPYRDWLIGALNDDIPFSRFVAAQLAGEQTGDDAATGFLVGGAHDVVGSPDIELTLTQRMNDLDDMVSTTGSAFLGLSVGCARCHDHKFDPISQRDYYALQAIFAGVQHGERELRTSDQQARATARAQAQRELDHARERLDAAMAKAQPLATLQPDGPGRRASVSARWNADHFAPVHARYVRLTVMATSQLEPCIDELEVFSTDDNTNLALASAGGKPSASSVYAGGSSSLHRLEHVNDGRYGNARSWISSEPGSGWVQIELAQSSTIDRVVWARDREGGYRDRLATQYEIAVSDDGHEWRKVATSQDRNPYNPDASPDETNIAQERPADAAREIETLRAQVEALAERVKSLAPEKIYAGTFADPPLTHLLHRGEPTQKRDEVSPAAIAAVSPNLSLARNAPEPERRMSLARWIADPANPLPSRVMVNRLWQHHFGQAIVRTPSDLGFNGGQPSHPELLDWLAAEFRAHDGRLKPLHRLIVLSNTYRQGSVARAEASAQDAGNRLLWRFSPRRLEAEAIRDAVLAVSGALDLRMGGPGYEVFEPNTNYVKVYAPKQAFGPAEWRRMVYQNKPRMRQDSTFGEFDCPDSSQTMARRNVSTTALQALNLLNGPFMLEQARLFAERVEREAGPQVAGQVRRAFWLAFGREPDQAEATAAQAIVAQDGLLVFCRALFNANEFLFVN
jgi:mono/diheme cytochrome c family protein